MEYSESWFRKVQSLFDTGKRLLLVIIFLVTIFSISFLAFPDILIDLNARQEARTPATGYNITQSECLLNSFAYSACLVTYQGPGNKTGQFYYSIFDSIDEKRLLIEETVTSKTLTTNLGMSFLDDRIISLIATLAVLILLTFWTGYYPDIVAFIKAPSAMKPVTHLYTKAGWVFGMILCIVISASIFWLQGPPILSDFKIKNEDRLPVPGYSQTEATCSIKLYVLSYCKFEYNSNQASQKNRITIKKEYFFLGYFSSSKVTLERTTASGVITTNIGVNNVWNRILGFIGFQLFLLLGFYGCYSSLTGKEEEETAQNMY